MCATGATEPNRPQFTSCLPPLFRGTGAGARDKARRARAACRLPPGADNRHELLGLLQAGEQPAPTLVSVFSLHPTRPLRTPPLGSAVISSALLLTTEPAPRRTISAVRPALHGCDASSSPALTARRGNGGRERESAHAATAQLAAAHCPTPLPPRPCASPTFKRPNPPSQSKPRNSKHAHSSHSPS